MSEVIATPAGTAGMGTELAPHTAAGADAALAAEAQAAPAVSPLKRSSKPRVVLVGPPGAGKSTIGRRLSRALNCSLVDSDLLIEKAQGKTCGEVFAECGEPRFREIEAAHVAEALNSDGVVSLGGGAVLTESTRDLLEEHTVVLIDVSAEEGARRTAEENTRPVLAAKDPLAHYRALLEARAPYYKEVADFRARTDGRTPQQVVADILGFLESL